MTAGESVVLADILERKAAEHPDRVYAVFEDGTEWTFGDVADGAWRAGAGLVALGIAPGDRVLNWLPSGPEALLSWFGTSAAGGVWAPLNPAYRGSILEHVVNLTGARVLVTQADMVERLGELDLPHLESVVVVGDELPATSDGVRLVRWDELMDHPSKRPVLDAPRHDSDDQMVLFTSGTTGPSKGVRCSSIHHDWAQRALLPDEITAEDRYYECLPFFHLAGTATVYGMLARGGSIAVTSGFRTAQFWDDARRLGVTAAMIITSMSNELMNRPPSPDDRDHPLRLVLMAPLIVQTREFAERFGVQMYSTYGMSEMPVPFRSDYDPLDHTSCGKVWNDEWEVRIVDEHDHEVPIGKPGELIARHRRPWVLNSGYVDMPEATAEAWRNGWFHTGDLFRRDADGNYFFLDRRKDVIRRRGENISSFEVEKEVVTHPDVAEAAAFAVSDGYKEDEVMVALVAVEGQQIDPGVLLAYLEPRMPRFMLPRYVEVVNELPKSSSMKVQKAELRAVGITPTTWDRREMLGR